MIKPNYYPQYAESSENTGKGEEEYLCEDRCPEAFAEDASGHQSHHGGEGAGIGAAVGVVSGAVIGSQIEKKQSGQAAPQGTQAQNPNQMSTEQIIDMSKQGIHEDAIVDKIRLSNSRFVLSPDDINNLKQQGVSQKVINAMQGV